MKRRWLWAAAGLLAAAGAAVQLVRADRFAEAVRGSAEKGLRRKLEIGGPVRFSLWARGFTAEQVVIHEDPAYGVEPFAYVPLMEASIRLSSLLSGQLEFSRLRLVEPSINLAQTEGVGWNVQPLIEQTLVRGRARGEPVPELSVDDGRINFRLGEMKSIYYLANADLQVEAGGDPDQLSLYFEGEPARTDQGARGFGRVSGRGSLGLRPGARRVDLQLFLTRTSIAEFLMLAQGRGAGLGGFFSARANLSGPWENIRLSGRAQLEGFERWNWLVGPGRGPAIEWAGSLDLQRQRIEITTTGKDLPVSVSARGSDFLKEPHWATVVNLRGLPAESMQALGSELGLELPFGLRASGRVSGAVSYDRSRGVRGMLEVLDAAVSQAQAAAAERAETENLRVVVEGERVRLEPAVWTTGPGQKVRAEGGFGADGSSVSAKMQTTSLAVARLREWRVPLLEQLTEGAWTGTLRYERDKEEEGRWSAEGELQDAVVRPAGLLAPLRMARAAVRIQGGAFSLTAAKAEMQETSFDLEFRRDGRIRRPDTIRIRAEHLQLARLLSCLGSSQSGRGLLARTLRLRRQEVPPWVLARNLAGTIEAAVLDVEPGSLTAASLQFRWDGPRIDISSLSARSGQAALRGQALVALGADGPSYDAQASVERFPWRGGEVDGDWKHDGESGTWTAELNFRNVELNSEFTFAPATAVVQGRPERGWSEPWRWTVTSFEGESGGETWKGKGESLPDGRVALDLSSGGRMVRLAGFLAEGAWEPLR